MTPDEARYEEYMDQLYEEHKEQAIEEFIDERLQSYYGEHRLLAEPAFGAFTEAKKLIHTSATAAFLFSAISVEVGLRETLVKPFVFAGQLGRPEASLAAVAVELLSAAV